MIKGRLLIIQVKRATINKSKPKSNAEFAMSKTILEKYTAKLKIIHEKAKKSKELLKY